MHILQIVQEKFVYSFLTNIDITRHVYKQRADVSPEKWADESCGLFTLPDMDSDPDPGTDFRPKHGYNNDWGSRSESKSPSPESVSGNVNKPLLTCRTLLYRPLCSLSAHDSK